MHCTVQYPQRSYGPALDTAAPDKGSVITDACRQVEEKAAPVGKGMVNYVPGFSF